MTHQQGKIELVAALAVLLSHHIIQAMISVVEGLTLESPIVRMSLKEAENKQIECISSTA